ncbi:gastrin/cholecystokinin type B receptor-like [Hydractinia symbiolongicarpus]|uniref:gastrin/cholecystokinin type B receptor-like n=1 Tax=Hydractinia symbiolongicarpus TaxID=13093 RepID=UPI00254C7951|nr:gastrin/cholecystokinin type B receptor-like [Hydractinia symbiolongicarpus]
MNKTSYNSEGTGSIMLEIAGITIFILGVIGNMLLLVCLTKLRYLKNLFEKLLFNLACCNLLLLLLSIPTSHVIDRKKPNYPFGAAGCKLIDPCSTYAANATALTLVAIAIQRYNVTARRIIDIPTARKQFIAIFSIHFVSFLSIIPFMMSLRYLYLRCNEKWSVRSRRIYTILLFCFQYAIPVPTMAVLYTKSWLVIYDSLSYVASITIRHEQKQFEEAEKSSAETNDKIRDIEAEKKSIQDGVENASPRIFCAVYYIMPKNVKRCEEIIGSNHVQTKAFQIRLRQSRNILKMFSAIVVLYAIFFLPHHLLWLYIDFASVEEDMLQPWLVQITYLMTYINSVLNPWMHGKLRKRFRAKIRELRSNMF